MTPPFRYRLSDREKDALLSEQATLIERQAARIAELEMQLAALKQMVSERSRQRGTT